MDQSLYESTCLELDLIPHGEELNEAGGFLSVLKRYFSGQDRGIEDEIRQDLAAMKTEKDRADLLRLLQSLIEEAEGVIERGIGTHALMTVISAAGIGVTAGILTGKIATVAKVAGWLPIGGGPGYSSTELVDTAMTITGLVARTAAGIGVAFAAVRIIANITRMINLKRGSIAEYLQALKVLRDEVTRAKI